MTTIEIQQDGHDGAYACYYDVVSNRFGDTFVTHWLELDLPEGE